MIIRATPSAEPNCGSCKHYEPRHDVCHAPELVKQVTGKLKNPCDSLLTDDSDGDKESKSKLDHGKEWIIGCIKHDGFIHTARFDKANQIILDALEEPSGDLISRQDAIDAVTRAIWHYPNECYKNLNVYEVAEALVGDAINSLPSAETPTDTPTESTNASTVFIDGIGHFPKLSETSQNPTKPNKTCGGDLISRADAMGAVQDHFNADGFKGDDLDSLKAQIKKLRERNEELMRESQLHHPEVK